MKYLSRIEAEKLYEIKSDSNLPTLLRSNPLARIFIVR